MCSTSNYVFPGQKLCPQCRSHATKPKDIEEMDVDTEDTDVDTEGQMNAHCFEEEEEKLNSTRESLNITLNDLEISSMQ